MKTRREFLKWLSVMPVAYSFLGSGIWTPQQVPLTIYNSIGSHGEGKWTHVLVQGFVNPESNGYFKITGTDYVNQRYTLKRTKQQFRNPASAGILAQPIPKHRITDDLGECYEWDEGDISKVDFFVKEPL